MAVPVSQIRYLKRQNVQNAAKLQAGYYRELINQYGVDTVWFMRQSDFFSSPVSGSEYSDYTYGSVNGNSQFDVSANIITYVKIDSYSPMMKNFGFQTVTNAECYVMKKDFEEQWRDIIGNPVENVFVTDVYADINSFTGYITGEVIGNGLSGMTSAFTTVPSGTVSGTFNHPFTRYPEAYNEQLYRTEYFTEMDVQGNLSGNLIGSVDISGNGYVSGTVSGTLYYFDTNSDKSINVWGIAPQVGNIIRLTEYYLNDGNHPEFEISEIIDEDLSPNGLNPHLFKYIWKCSLTRRDPSHEIMIGSAQQESFTPNHNTQSDWHEIVSDGIFDYVNPVDTLDQSNSDDVYGGYGR